MDAGGLRPGIERKHMAGWERHGSEGTSEQGWGAGSGGGGRGAECQGCRARQGLDRKEGRGPGQPEGLGGSQRGTREGKREKRVKRAVGGCGSSGRRAGGCGAAAASQQCAALGGRPQRAAGEAEGGK